MSLALATFSLKSDFLLFSLFLESPATVGVFWTVWVQPTGTHFPLFVLHFTICVCMWCLCLGVGIIAGGLQVVADKASKRVLDRLGLELQVVLSC